MMLKEIVDELKLVGDGIKSVKTIVEAVKSGKDYIKQKHPDIRQDVRVLIEELQKSLLLIKRASAVLTNFRFAVSADSQGLELARFNDYFIESKTEALHLENHIDDLRTHCTKIREHAGKIGGETTATGFTKVFEFLGLNSPERERRLGKQLDELAYEDFAVANSAKTMLDSLVKALRHVQDALGDGGAMYPQNVPVAAGLLAKYGPEFEKTEEQAELAIKVIRELVADLQ